jgi:hypothetical protein
MMGSTISLNPFDMISNRNYISLFMPSKFNMTVMLFPETTRASYLEMVIRNDSAAKYVKIDGESKVDFYNIIAGGPLKILTYFIEES